MDNSNLTMDNSTNLPMQYTHATSNDPLLLLQGSVVRLAAPTPRRAVRGSPVAGRRRARRAAAAAAPQATDESRGPPHERNHGRAAPGPG